MFMYNSFTEYSIDIGELKLNINQGLHLLLYPNDLACLCTGSTAPLWRVLVWRIAHELQVKPKWQDRDRDEPPPLSHWTFQVLEGQPSNSQSSRTETSVRDKTSVLFKNNVTFLFFQTNSQKAGFLWSQTENTLHWGVSFFLCHCACMICSNLDSKLCLDFQDTKTRAFPNLTFHFVFDTYIKPKALMSKDVYQCPDFQCLQSDRIKGAQCLSPFCGPLAILNGQNKWTRILHLMCYSSCIRTHEVYIIPLYKSIDQDHESLIRSFKMGYHARETGFKPECLSFCDHYCSHYALPFSH